MAGFVLAVVNIYWLARVLAALLGLYSKTLRRHNKRLARALTINGALLVGLQSVGQLSIRDLVVLIPLVAGSYLYLSLVRPGKIDT